MTTFAVPTATTEVAAERLRSMKRVATAVLVFAAVVFVVTSVVPDSTAVGFVRAAAEAAMVGGLADWFAITALFRRPLGLPIPHTALIPTRKDALAGTLGEFVTTSFLTRENVGARLADADIVSKVAAWLVDERNAQRLAEEVAVAADGLADVLDGDVLAELVLSTARTDTARRAYAPLLGRLLQTTVEDRGHQALTDIVLTGAHRWLVANRHEIVPELKERIEDGGTFLWLLTTTRRVDRVVGSAIDYIQDASLDQGHELRALIDRLLLIVAGELQAPTEMAAQINEEARRVLDDPAIREWLVEVIDGGLLSLRETIRDREGVVVRQIAAGVVTHARRVQDDPVLHARLDGVLQRAAFHAIDHYADEFTALVETTVARWDGNETARRVELLAGRDLQFIRINGSVVGSIAGVAIHAVGLLL
jgi:uncharacterized membrane-anchored protein YjiN (DUF445 family)